MKGKHLMGLVLLLFLMCISLNGQTSCRWESSEIIQNEFSDIVPKTPQNLAYPMRTIRKIFFINDNSGWILGKTFVLKTNDGGKSWKVKKFAVPYLYFIDIYFINPNDGWINSHDGRNSFIYGTKDGGESWHVLNKKDNRFNGVKNIRFVDKNIGWGVGNRPVLLKASIMETVTFKPVGNIWQTKNGGRNWNIAYSSEDGIDSLEILKNGNIIAGNGKTGVLLKSKNQKWRKNDNSQGISFAWDFESVGNNEIWAISGDYKILYSSDNGENWTIKNLNIANAELYEVQTIKFIDSQNGWLVGEKKDKSSQSQPLDEGSLPTTGIILHTTDGGKTWTVEHQGQASLVVDMAKTQNYLYAVGDNGLIMRRPLNGCQ